MYLKVSLESNITISIIPLYIGYLGRENTDEMPQWVLW